MKIGDRELTAEEEAQFRKRLDGNTKEEMGIDLVQFSYAVLDFEERVTDLEEELEITDEICDDLRTEVEQKDNTIRSLVAVCKHLASKAV